MVSRGNACDKCARHGRRHHPKEVKAAIGLSHGTESPMVKKRAKIPSVVKIEPDLSSDDCCISFSAEVKTLSYLELPVRIPYVPGRRERTLGKAVYLRDSMERVWAVLCPG